MKGKRVKSGGDKMKVVTTSINVLKKYHKYIVTPNDDLVKFFLNAVLCGR